MKKIFFITIIIGLFHSLFAENILGLENDYSQTGKSGSDYILDRMIDRKINETYQTNYRQCVNYGGDSAFYHQGRNDHWKIEKFKEMIMNPNTTCYFELDTTDIYRPYKKQICENQEERYYRFFLEKFNKPFAFCERTAFLQLHIQGVKKIPASFFRKGFKLKK